MASRLTSWNLFFSASAYERGEPIGEASLQDLSALIDALCLYDELRVIGDPTRTPFLTHDSEFFDGIRDSGAVKVSAVSRDQHGEIFHATKRHLLAYLGPTALEFLDEWLAEALTLNEIPPEPKRRATMNLDVRLNPPELIEVERNEHALRQLTSGAVAKNERTFLVRSFMYYAHAEIEGIPWIPDSSRSALVGSIARREGDLAAQLAEQLRRSWRDTPFIGGTQLRERISPFAAVVIERCSGERARLPEEIRRIRHELAPVRSNIGELEHQMLYESRDTAVRAEKRWKSALAEVARAYGAEPRVVSFAQGLSLAKEAGALVDDPLTTTNWISALLSVPVEAAARLLRRRPVAQIHRLRLELPAAGRLGKALVSIFPELTRMGS